MANVVNNILSVLGQTMYGYLLNSGFLARPIGIVGKNYQHMLNNIMRNIGSNTYDYDGFGNSIGELAEPYFNGTRYVPWFKLDTDKSRYANYIRYVEGVRDTSLDLHASFNISNIIIKQDAAKPLSQYYTKNERIAYENDTYGAKLNTSIAQEFLIYSAQENSERLQRNKDKFGGHSISKDIYDYFGWNASNVSSGKLSYTIGDNGRVSIPSLTDTADNDYGDYRRLVTYQATSSSLSDMQKKYIYENLKDNTYAPQSPFEVESGRTEFTSTGNTYIDQFGLIGSVEPLTAKTYALDTKYTGRYEFTVDKSKNTNNTTMSSRSIFLEYAEMENGSTHQIPVPVGYGQASKHKSFDALTADMQNSKQLLHTTQAAFNNGKYETIVARFHTNTVDLDNPTQTAISKKYGMSHGRNLLKTRPTEENGYENPYCRTWTYHHQYARVSDQIRPFKNFYQQTASAWKSLRAGNGGERLYKLGVKTGNAGNLKISPNKSSRDIKNCMFSIENLAWKGVKDLSSEQKGPLGGRIMWFPPYGISFNEQVSTSWNGTKFIGRGEQIYTYVNTDRTGTLKFKMLIDHPSILDYWNHKNYNLGDNVGSSDSSGIAGTVDDINDPEQELLRFFAGCEILNVGSSIETTPTETVLSPEPNSIDEKTRKLVFYVFYPNDYSGMDDDGDTAMAYLINGIGTSKISDKIDAPIIVNDEYVKIENEGYFSVNCPIFFEDGNVLGYEMYPRGTGISIMDETEYSDIITGLTSTGKINNQLMYTVETSAGQSYSIYTQQRHGHRVDKNVEGDLKASGKTSIEQYLDLASYGFNSSYGYMNAINGTVLKGNNNGNEEYVSFADMYAFLNNDYRMQIQELGTSGSSIINKDNLERITEIFSSYEIGDINIIGFASTEKKSNNPVGHNNSLSLNRAKSVANWLKSALNRNNKKYGSITSTGNGAIGGNLTIGNHSTENSKAARCAKVIINYNPVKNNNLNSTQKMESEYDTTVGNPNDSEEKNREAANKTVTVATSTTSSNGVAGKNHDLEYQFFQQLEENSPLMKSRISDKIKYFDPAFHSISPEGFNARLTFLHQCTRQGPTISASDTSLDRTANNLSFGRPPVCVLRIGDFFYTRILIQSLNIDYEPLQWDLNDEGIGVMPMIADINITFTFIGGSDLAGPIERLQNAVSFNYYANTGVYDTRSDRVAYNDDGSIASYEAYVPEMEMYQASQGEIEDADTDDKSGNNVVNTDTLTGPGIHNVVQEGESGGMEGLDKAEQMIEEGNKKRAEEAAKAKESEEKKKSVRTQNSNNEQKKRNNSSGGSSTNTKTSNAGKTGSDEYYNGKKLSGVVVTGSSKSTREKYTKQCIDKILGGYGTTWTNKNIGSAAIKGCCDAHGVSRSFGMNYAIEWIKKHSKKWGGFGGGSFGGGGASGSW